MSDFDPKRYLTKLGAADYLEVKYRLLWLRTEHPDAVIETVLIADDIVGNTPVREAVFKAKVTLPTGGSATGWGSETTSDFKDYREKAETKAIGRALAALGYGTQFAPDFQDGSSAGRPVDAPVGGAPPAHLIGDQSRLAPRDPDAPASQPQKDAIRRILNDNPNLDPIDDDLLYVMTKQEASEWITKYGRVRR